MSATLTALWSSLSANNLAFLTGTSFVGNSPASMVWEITCVIVDKSNFRKLFTHFAKLSPHCSLSRGGRSLTFGSNPPLCLCRQPRKVRCIALLAIFFLGKGWQCQKIPLISRINQLSLLKSLPYSWNIKISMIDCTQNSVLQGKEYIAILHQVNFPLTIWLCSILIFFFYVSAVQHLNAILHQAF